MDFSNYNACDCACQPINYSSTSFGGQFPGLNVPSFGGGLTFTSTDFSQELACGMGREISFAAFMQMGSSLGAAAEAMIILAMNQCNNVLNENEALIAGPASSSSSTTKTTIYHEKVCATDKGAPDGATDAYIQNYKGADGYMHQEITYVDANGKEIGQRDFVLDNNKALGTVTLTTDANKDGKIDAGDTVTINGKNYILVDTGKTDCDGNKIYSLDTVDANGKDTGQSVGTVSFNANGTVDHSSILDYSTFATDTIIPGFAFATSTSSLSQSTAAVTIGSNTNSITVGGYVYNLNTALNFTDANGVKYNAYADAAGNVIYIPATQSLSTNTTTNITIYKAAVYGGTNGTTDQIQYGGYRYTRDAADDKLGYYAYKNANGDIIYVDPSKLKAGAVSLVTLGVPAGLPDAYATYNQGGKGVSLSELGSNSAPTTNSTTTTPVNQNTADPLTTMAAVFKYAEVYAEAMTMMSVYYQNNIDNFKNRPH